MSTIKVNGITMYYELHGEEGGEVLVLNNGIIMNAATSWAFQTKTLAEHFRVLQYDMRGQGQSDHPDEPYSMRQHADDLAGLLDQLGIGAAHIAGISYGGEVAQSFALAYPERTMSLILMDTVSEARAELRIVIESWMDALRLKDPGMFFNATVPWNFSPDFIRNHPALLEDARKRYAALDFEAILRLCEAFLDVNFTSELGKIECPVCIIAGERDILKGPEYAKIIQGQIPGAMLHILPGAGHATCWESADGLNETILNFLRKERGVGRLYRG